MDMRKEKSLLHRPIYLNKEPDYIREIEEQMDRREKLTQPEKIIIGFIGIFVGGMVMGYFILGIVL